MGFINLHPALLPDYRGMAPQHWPLINGEKETGVTVHYVDETADTGDIIIQERIPLSQNDYVTDLQKKWMKVYSHIMVEAIERITDSQFKPQKQSHLKGRYYDKLKENECVLRKDMTPTEAYNLIRGVSMPYFGARYENVIIWRGHIPNEDEKFILALAKLKTGVNLDTQLGPILHLDSGDIVIDKLAYSESANNQIKKSMDNSNVTMNNSVNICKMGGGKIKILLSEYCLIA